MGTKVEGKRYVPGYFTMGHVNLIMKSNNWPPYYEEKPVNSHNFYNEFAPSPTNGYTCYDKEMLKQTILQHEATFRKQVNELHRLYKKQKDLMENYQRPDLDKPEGLMWKIQHQNNSIEKPFAEFVTGAPTRNGNAGLDLNEPGIDCSEVERSSVNFAGFQGITEEGTSMNNSYNAPGDITNGWKFIKGEINGRDMNGMDFFYPSTNSKKANGFLSQHENNMATSPWLKQEQTNNHASIPVCNTPDAPNTRSISENRCIRDLDLNLNDSLPEEEPQIISFSKTERNFIDLNDSLPWTDDIGSPSEVSARPTGVQIGVAKHGFVIDLEALPACEEEVLLHDSHATAAAEAILAISASVPPNQNSTDTLAWFANVATSNSIEISSETELDVSSDEGSVESFEALALKLEETKLEEGYHDCANSKMHEVEMQDVATALTTRALPRRGRRRQKKDFQKDILPGLVHLKKREVTEDLQIFGKVGPTKRVGRKPKNVEPDPVPVGPSCQTGVAPMAGEGLVSALGWGQITRRCRKQRLPHGKVSVNPK
ncbi:uncharacterized protein LOC144572367 [Carex rostrata]